ncbi:MAG: hypothetical protein Q7V53_02945 [Caldisericota bacterium]|nr:hypothetical protein [Caldisericota bacterium]
MAVRIDAISEPITYAKIVSDYIKRCRPTQLKEFAWFAQKQTYKKSLQLIASAQLSDDGFLFTSKADHQRRLKDEVLKKAESSLLAFEMEIRKASTFEELHQVVKDALFFVKGAGDLYAYDTALRIAARRGSDLLPDKVYLIAGAKEGAKHIFAQGAGRATVMESAAFPREFQKLMPYEIHNLLCSYRNHLARVHRR